MAAKKAKKMSPARKKVQKAKVDTAIAIKERGARDNKERARIKKIMDERTAYNKKNKEKWKEADKKRDKEVSAEERKKKKNKYTVTTGKGSKEPLYGRAGRYSGRGYAATTKDGDYASRGAESYNQADIQTWKSGIAPTEAEAKKVAKRAKAASAKKVKSIYGMK